MYKNKVIPIVSSFFWGACGFALTLGTIHKVTPNFSPKEPRDITRSTSAFDALFPGQADVVVIGTSHMYRAFDPLRFEEKTGLSAYNLSFNGMSAPEMRYMVERVATQAKSKKIKSVIIEGRGLALPDENNLNSPRIIHGSRPMDWQRYKPISMELDDVKYWLPRIKSAAAVSRLQSYEFATKPKDYTPMIERAELRRRQLKDQGIILKGSNPLKEKVRAARRDIAIQKHKGFGAQSRYIKVKAQPNIRVKYQELSGKKPKASRLSKADRAHYQEMIKRLKKAKVKTHIILPPTISPEWIRSHEKFAGTNLKVPVFDLRIHKYSREFQDLFLWADHGHLNQDGALIFTDLLADKYMERLQPTLFSPAITAPIKAAVQDCEVNTP